MSSYGLNDDISNIRSLDTMDLLSTSPPKQTGKAPSIFSPEWNEKSSSATSNNGSNLLSNIDHGSNGGSDPMNALPSLSPKRDYDKRAMSSSDITKKEKHMDHHQQQQQQQQPQYQQSHRSSHHGDKSSKRDVTLSAGMQYDASLPQILLDGKAVKRSYTADMGQLDSSEYQQRDIKIRKTEQLSPIQNVSELAKSAMSSKFASMNGIESKFMESPNSDKYGKLGEYSKGSGNAVSITTDLVNSLIKESLNDGGNKYGATLDAQQKKPSSSAKHQDQQSVAGYNMPQQQVMDAREQQQQHHLHQQRQPHTAVTDEIDRAQNINQYPSQHSQHRVDSKRMQQVSGPAPMSRQPPSKGMPAQNVDEQQFNEQQQQQQQKMSQLQQEQNNQSVYGGGQSLPTQLQIKNEADQRVKSEKKKKKEKHKNKDKEKSKNREEKKKHKKDKDRHKDKRKSPASGHETSGHDTKSPIRLKLNLSNTEHHASSSTSSHYDSQSAHNDGIGAGGGGLAQGEQLKLKITRDRINLDAALENKQSTPTSFKIKIPKQVVQNYNGGGANVYNNQQMHLNELGHPQNPSAGNSGTSGTSGSGSGSGSSKKKDKNRDRDKSMRNSANLSNSTKVHNNSIFNPAIHIT